MALIVSIKPFHSLRDYAPRNHKVLGSEMMFAEDATARTLFKRLGIPQNTMCLIFVNGVRVSMDHTLNTGDHVTLMEPVGGG